MNLIFLVFTPVLLMLFSFCFAVEELPKKMLKVMNQKKYDHAIWGIYAKDLETGEILFDLNSNKLFSPASTTKLFSVATLLEAFGDEYRFKTPVYATQPFRNGKLEGNLILIAQGDLTFGGRQSSPDKISFTKLDHINANEIPGVILTKEDPLHGIDELAKQVYQRGLRELTGDVIIDDRLFETTIKRGLTLSPICINENLLDFVIDPTAVDEKAKLAWRPKAPGYEVNNEVKTVPKGGPLNLEITADENGRRLVVNGTIPIDQKNIVRTFPIKDPRFFARAAFIKALETQGIRVNIKQASDPFKIGSNLKVAEWISPPLSEYAKLILKVSHNLGADLVPLLLAAQQGKKTFDEGMRLLGDFAAQKIKLAPDEFVFIDGAGGNENRLTPQAEVALLEYMHKYPSNQFLRYFDALPILGVDGSLEDFAKKASGGGKVRAKPGTGVAFNLATGQFFLITQALAGYIEGRNGHLFAYAAIVNNGKMPAIDDVFAIFEDISQISSIIYDNTDH